jgi:hypothetical protein
MATLAACIGVITPITSRIMGMVALRAVGGPDTMEVVDGDMAVISMVGFMAKTEVLAVTGISVKEVLICKS